MTNRSNTFSQWEMMRMALREAKLSRDPRTQNSAIIAERVPATDLYVPLIVAVNNFPVGVAHSALRWERPAKYNYVVHAERNSIYLAAHNNVCTRHTVMFSPYAPCTDCAHGIIQAGIEELVRLDNLGNTNQSWAESCSVADEILKEAGVKVVELTDAPSFNVVLRRDGHEVTL